LIHFIKLNKTYEYQYRLCRPFSFPQLSSQRSKRVAYIKICYKTAFFSKLRGYFDIYVMELNQTLCVHENIKYKYFISLPLSPKRSNKHNTCMMHMHSPSLRIIISHMYETLSSFHLNLRVHLTLHIDIDIGYTVILTNVNILNI